MNELIEKLMFNERHRIFGDMSEKEQNCLIEANQAESLEFLSGDMKWHTRTREGCLGNAMVYRIKPDYQPEFVDLEIIELDCGCLGVEGVDIVPCSQRLLYCLPSLPNFEGFIEKSVDGTLAIERIARYRTEGKTVYARLRK